MSAQVAELPYVTAKSLRVLGKIRTLPEDFRVDEVPAYPPAGHGSHLFVRFEKRNLTTREAVGRIAAALHVNPRDAGVAGQKDKHALTTQWASFPGATAESALGLQLDAIRVLEAVPHPHKLRTGHVRANRFALLIRDATAEIAARELVAELSRLGVPNYYGEQRFGAAERNVARAHAMLRGGSAPRDHFERKLLISALQSALFNDWLAARIRDGLYDRPIAGDVLRKEDSGGLFTTDDDEDALRRVLAWEISPTGPMFGAKMRRAERDAGAREQAILDGSGVDMDALARFARYAEGTRRVCRVALRDCAIDLEPQGVRLGFELPSGAYATAVLRELMKPHVT